MLMVVGVLALGASLLGAAVLLALILWKWGAGLARVLGLFLILSNLYRLMLAVFVPWVLGSAALWLAVGVLLWLFGHWVHIVRYRRARSPLAQRVFALPGLRALVPSAARP
ncbi:hypothetical protein [Nocardia terpenica]|uniref:Uncharacterized protein n=1 Tax=Nocardia terpenica TaxID=455432 RepID=A0A291RYZ4_9NOCA|nr:hypothetical protein [Nocardia terpenica]ATL72492.1 hypothetical protein CRH09_39655 [Nocardia terpenica]